VIVLAQLNRKVEDRRGNRPMMSDLKESGSIEQDADMVLLLYREEYYKKTDENEGIVDVIVAKQRNGPTGDFRLRFDAPTTRFSNLTDRQYSNNEEHRQHH
jgi:replicative DNA helicase